MSFMTRTALPVAGEGNDRQKMRSFVRASKSHTPTNPGLRHPKLWWTKRHQRVTPRAPTHRIWGSTSSWAQSTRTGEGGISTKSPNSYRPNPIDIILLGGLRRAWKKLIGLGNISIMSHPRLEEVLITVSDDPKDRPREGRIKD